MAGGSFAMAYIKAGWPEMMWRGGDVRLEVEQPPLQLAETLAASMVPQRVRTQSHYLLGSVNGDHLRVGLMKGMSDSDARSVLLARIEPAGTGSLISGRFGLIPWVRTMGVLAMATGGLLLLLEAVGFLATGRFIAPALPILGVVAMFGVTLQRWLAMRDEPRIVNHLRTLGERH